MSGPVAFLAAAAVPHASEVAGMVCVLAGLPAFGLLLRRACLRAGRAREEAGRLRRLADATIEGILFLRDGIVVDANAAVCALLGLERRSLIGRPLDALLNLPDAAALPAESSMEAELVDAGGMSRPIELLSRALPATDRREQVLALRDISDRRQAEARLQYLVHHDGLTGLANRTLFEDRLAQAISLAEHGGRELAVLCLDLDGFKAVNELLGYPAGDKVLVEVGNRLSACLRETDTVARLGSDEFAILQSPGGQPRSAAALADRIVRLLGEPFDIDGHRIVIGTSVGVALHPFDGRRPETLLRHAGLAQHRAKEDGRGLSRFFEPRMDEQQQQRRRLWRDLREALPRGELRLHYQPLRNGTSLQVEGFEALLRWQHPDRGLVPPGVFVPIAEECGLINAFGAWVLETACAEAARWPEPWRIAVNLSPMQFRQHDLAATVREVLAASGLAPSRLELEITENILIDDADRALATLRALKALGVRIALDDFGTGYSSLSYLRRFPFDTLKIDASFVQALGDCGEADAIVRAIVALGRSLSLRVTAEGVETDEQLRLLRAQSCDEVQGFLVGRPLPSAEIRRMQPSMLATVPA